MAPKTWTYGAFLEQIRRMRQIAPLVERAFPNLGPSTARDAVLDECEKVLVAMTDDELEIQELLDPKRGPARRDRIAERAGVPAQNVLQFVRTFAKMERFYDQVTGQSVDFEGEESE